jgi:hypothetical protein
MGLGYEIRNPAKIYSGSRIPDLGVKKAPDPGNIIDSIAPPPPLLYLHKKNCSPG